MCAAMMDSALCIFDDLLLGEWERIKLGQKSIKCSHSGLWIMDYGLWIMDCAEYIIFLFLIGS